MNKLLETLLKSEFKFGFELEAYVGSSVLDNYIYGYTYDNDYADDEYYADDGYYENENEGEVNEDSLYEDLSYYFSKFFGTGVRVVGDGSLDSSRGGFEFPTPPMNLTPANIKKCINFLDSIKKDYYHIYTDETCGFHTHISFPQMTNEDMVWILCHLALDANFQDELLSFKTTAGEEFDFFGHWATTDYLQDIESAIKLEDWNELNKWLTNEKYRLLRIHPQGTLEWRGPRNFLDNHNLQTIKEFFIKLLRVVSIIIKIMEKKEINGISKQNFFKLIDISNLETKPLKKDINDSIYKAIIKNPLILTKISKKYDVNWKNILGKLYDIVTDNGTKFSDFLVPLRYKHFNNEEILALLVRACPDFIYYTNNSLQKIIDIIDKYDTQFLTIYLTDKKLNTELLYTILANRMTTCSINNLIADFTYRLEKNYSVVPFFDKNVITVLKNRYYKTTVHQTNTNRVLQSFSTKYPQYQNYFKKFSELLS